MQPSKGELKYEEFSCFKERPQQNTRYLIQRNVDSLVSICLRQATQFVNTSASKLKGLEQLKYTILLSQEGITKHFENIIRTMVKVSQLDIENSYNTIKQIMQLLGYFVKCEYYVPLIANMLAGEDFKTSNKNTFIILNFYAELLRNNTQIQPHFGDIIKLIAHYIILFPDSEDGILALNQIASILVQKIQCEIKSEQITTLFFCLLEVLSTHNIKGHQRQLAYRSMRTLSQKAGFGNIAALHSHELSPILSKIRKQKSYTNWNKSTKERFRFDTIVRNCQLQIDGYMEGILEVMEWMVGPQSDIQMRMDTLTLLQYMISKNQLADSLKRFSLRIMKKLLIVSIQWKVGKPQIKIRKAGVINMMNVITKGIIKEEQLMECFGELLPPLKNCLSDDWAPQLRYASCQLVQKYLLATKQNLGDDQLRQLYACLLQRLDDSQDPIRKKITTAINVFFSCRYLKFSSSTLQYMINNIFIHFDDSSQEIQQAIGTTLRFAARVDPHQVLTTANVNLKRMKHHQKCQQLIQYCQEIIQQQKL